AVSIPGVQLSGNFTLAINTSSAVGGVNQTLYVGNQPTKTRALLLGDVNGDSRPDLIVGTDTEGTFVYLNDGSANPYVTLPPIVIGGSGSDQTTSLALGDLDSDGDPDLVVGNTGTNHLYLNDGHGSFTGVAVSIGSGASAVAIGDLSGDGIPDVIVGTSSGPKLYVNNGNPAPPAPTDPPRSGSDGTTTAASSTFTVATGAFATADVGKVIEIAGTPYAITAVGAGTPPVTTLTLDRNAALVGGSLSWRIAWNGFATATTPFSSDTSAPSALALADLDKDGKLDVIVANGGAGQKNHVYRYTGSGFSVSDLGTQTLGTKALAVGDVNGDGYLDVVAGNTTGTSFV